jgi:phosphatidylinositol alpha-1,6-mannosyltransferase
MIPPVTGRVVLVVNNFPPVRGGSAVVYANLARCAGERMIVIAPRLGYNDGLPLIGWREHDRHKPYRMIRLGLLRTRMRLDPPRGLVRLSFLASDVFLRVRLACVLLWLVLRHRVRAICIGELTASAWIVNIFGWLPGIRTLAYVHGEEITTEDLYDPGHHRAHRALLACDTIVVVSRFTERAVAALLGSRAGQRIRLIENGVDTARFTPSAKAGDLLDVYGLRGRFVFVSVCRLLEKKGIDNTLRAFARLRGKLPDCRYLVVGGGPYRGALEKLAHDLELGTDVVFAGQVADDELVDHYRLGDVFVMPNRELPNGDTEGFGLVFLEANGCGLPVIAGQDGGSTDAVSDGVNGLVVDGKSVDAIAGAMQRLHDDAGLRLQLRTLGLQAAAAAGWAEKTETFLALCTEK